MGKYIVKRILQVIPMLFILSLIVFMMVRLIPGDPVDMMLGMDIPGDSEHSAGDYADGGLGREHEECHHFLDHR